MRVRRNTRPSQRLESVENAFPKLRKSPAASRLVAVASPMANPQSAADASMLPPKEPPLVIRCNTCLGQDASQPERVQAVVGIADGALASTRHNSAELVSSVVHIDGTWPNLGQRLGYRSDV